MISNAADACEKLRHLQLQDTNMSTDKPLEIHIKLDKENKVLSIRDRGIGMTKEDLIKNLGTIAKSGTSGIFQQDPNFQCWIWRLVWY